MIRAALIAPDGAICCLQRRRTVRSILRERSHRAREVNHARTHQLHQLASCRMTRIVGVLGSVTPPGRLSVALSGALKRALDAGAEVDLIDLGNLHLDFADGRPPADHSDDSALVIEAIASADAVVFASPVYRGTYTGALKNLLDLLPVEVL